MCYKTSQDNMTLALGFTLAFHFYTLDDNYHRIIKNRIIKNRIITELQK